MTPRARLFTLAPVVLVAALASVGCGNNDEPYKPQPQWSGRKPNLPAPPALDSKPIKSGEAYTVYGAVHQLRSRIHEKDVNGKEIAIEGYIVESNIEAAPECAIHPTGKEDPAGCTAQLPSFYIADTKEGGEQKIRVVGWAKNFATVYDAMKLYDKSKDKPKEALTDDVFGVEVPYPLPAVGAKVRVSGTYGFSARPSTGVVSDPKNGVLMYKSAETLEPAATPASFKNKKI